MIDAQDVKDWEKLPLVSQVLTSPHMGAWLYYRDQRRDKQREKQIRAEVIEKIVKKTTIYIDDMKRFYEESQDSSFLCAIAEAQKIKRIIHDMEKEQNK